MKFEYYVLNYDWATKQVYNFNIFDNCEVQKNSEQEVRKYLRAPKKYVRPFQIFDETEQLVGFEALCKEIDSIIKWQEWGRREYEISVGDAFETNLDRFQKWDCYDQCKKNIPMITREIIYQYKEQLKNK